MEYGLHINVHSEVRVIEFRVQREGYWWNMGTSHSIIHAEHQRRMSVL